MDLPVMPPVKPMLAKAAKAIPVGDYVYEPKWDGFRCIVFRDGDEVELGSRNEKPLTRYFPDVCEAVRRAAGAGGLPERCVVDGEIVVVGPEGRLEFEVLQNRIHPAASRVARLAAETPASFVAFDVLALGGDDLRQVPFAERRERLLREVAPGLTPPVYVTPATTDPAEAEVWFERFEGVGLDGVVAKPVGVHYCEDKRVMVKVKHERTADCVVAGFRWHKTGPIVGSLLLGLYDDDGGLRHVGVTAAFTMARRAELVDELAPYRENALEGHPWAEWAEFMTASGVDSRGAGAMAGNRWNAGKSSVMNWDLACGVAIAFISRPPRPALRRRISCPWRP
jgi:ATP-dependent DNA ligase